jgi:ribosomal protein L37AE/L43A
MPDSMHKSYKTGYAAPRSRKIQLDRDRYRSHSLRASGGDTNCDHDFEPTPTVQADNFAIWKCTKCGREFKYETWESAE